MSQQDELGQRLRDAREQAGITRVEAARQMGVSERTLSNWERGVLLPSAIKRAAAERFLTRLTRSSSNLAMEEIADSVRRTGLFRGEMLERAIEMAQRQYLIDLERDGDDGESAGATRGA